MNQATDKMDFEELLTPYVQGKLDKAMRKHVESYAETDAEFNKKLKFELQLARNIKNSSESFAELTPSFHKLKQQIKSEPKKRQWLNIFSLNYDLKLSWFSPSMALASVAMICLGAYLLFSQQIDNNPAQNYETLSNHDSTQVFEEGKQYLRIIGENTQMSALKDEYNFIIESGPDSLNSFIVSISQNQPLSEQTLNDWRNDERLQLVEPLVATTAE